MRSYKLPFGEELETLLRLFGASLIVVGASAYVFTLGYLEAIYLPVLPDYFSATAFFLRAFFFSVASSISKTWIFPIIGASVFLALTMNCVAGIKSYVRWKARVLNSLDVIFVVISFFLLSAFYFCLKDDVFQLMTCMLLVLTSAASALVVISKSQKTFLPVSTSIFLAILSFFSLLVVFKAGLEYPTHPEKGIRERFPTAVNGDKPTSERGYLVWQSSEYRYWIICDELVPKTIGVNSSGGVFFLRYLTGSQRLKLCGSEN